MLLRHDTLQAIERGDVDLAFRRWKRAGYPDRDALLAELRGREGRTYRVRLHLAGPDPRIALRENAKLTKSLKVGYELSPRGKAWMRKST